MMINPYLFGEPDSLVYPSGRIIDYNPADILYSALANNSDIGSPNDYSGNGNHGALGLATFYPKITDDLTINGYRVFKFPNDSSGIGTGFKYYWTMPDLSSLTSGSGFVIARYDYNPETVNELGSGIWNLGGQDIANSIPYFDGNIYDDFGSSARKGFSSGGNANYNSQWFVYAVKSAASSWKAYRNGVELYSTATNTAQFATVPALGLSNNSAGIYYLAGWVGRFILFNVALSDAEMISFSNQLKTRYGIA